MENPGKFAFDAPGVVEKLFGRAFSFLREKPFAFWADAAESCVVRLSSCAALFYGAMLAVSSVVVSVRFGEARMLWGGVAGLAASLVASFAGGRILAAFKSSRSCWRGRAPSTEVCEAFAATYLFFGAMLLFAGLGVLFSGRGATVLFVTAAVCAFTALAFVCPGIAGLPAGDTNGSEAGFFTLFAFHLKVAARIVPYVWLALLACGGCSMLFTLGSDRLALNFVIGSAAGLFVLFLPVAAYLGYLALAAVVGVFESILSIRAAGR